jgi:predicted solute-binding protein
MAADVVSRHIRLYVNDYTRAIDEQAVHRLFTWAGDEGLFPPADPSLPLFA